MSGTSIIAQIFVPLTKTVLSPKWSHREKTCLLAGVCIQVGLNQSAQLQRVAKVLKHFMLFRFYNL